ncbi:MAG: hypothetical protein BMS9Abin33_0406 [Gammaproteobacteria bacterium]|nr:MAG: hypothetical protein BMS9Abin33_0406 [Gammaproteobacteria bacterium]
MKTKSMQLLRRMLVVVLMSGVGSKVYAEVLSLETALAYLQARHPLILSAELERKRAALQKDVVEAGLGWELDSSAGAAHDVNFVGSPTDRADINAGVKKKNTLGGTVGVDAFYQYEDSAISFSPNFPNPYEYAQAGLSYRQPLSQGLNNPDYQQGLLSAEADILSAEAQWQGARDGLAGQLLELYYAAALTRARIDNAKQAVQRARRLKAFVRNNSRLGLAEDKDLLQAEAQLRAQLATLENLNITWRSQRTGLNRLMGRPWDQGYSLIIPEEFDALDLTNQAVMTDVEANDSELKKQQARAHQFRASLARRKDKHKSQFDLVLSVANRTQRGEVAVGGNLNESDVVGGLRIEYRRPVSKKGRDAELSQAQFEYSRALLDVQAVKLDMRYTVNGLISEIEAAMKSVSSFEHRMQTEEQRLQETLNRYKTGRADISLVIQFENELNATRLVLAQQRGELARKQAELSLLRGTIWQDLPKVPPVAANMPGYKRVEP